MVLASLSHSLASTFEAGIGEASPHRHTGTAHTEAYRQAQTRQSFKYRKSSSDSWLSFGMWGTNLKMLLLSSYEMMLGLLCDRTC